MQEAKDRVEKENPPTASLEDILEFLAFALYKQGNLKRALQLTDQLVRLGEEFSFISVIKKPSRGHYYYFCHYL